MPGHDIIVVGASAGGVETLAELARGLPSDLPAAIFIVLHVPSYGTSVLPSILRRSGALPASHAKDGERIEAGHIYVAPPDHHLLIKRGHMRVVRGPRENSHRPAVDPLFRTAARAYGPRTVGVVLSGVLDDGTAGLAAIKLRGGVALVQNPEEALYSGMPRSAIENASVDRVLPTAEIAGALARLAHEPAAEGAAAPVSEGMEVETDIAELDMDAVENEGRPGVPSGFTCPECQGALWELRNGELIRFRCRVGHAYSPESLLAEQSERLETALWTALRALEERASLAGRMSDRARERGHDLAMARFEEQKKDAQEHAAILRTVLLEGDEATTAEQTAAARAPAEARGAGREN